MQVVRKIKTHTGVIMPEKMNVERHSKQLIFKSQDLDYYLQSVPFGFQTYGGGSVGEVIYEALKIKENEDPENWLKEWTALAAVNEKRAQVALERGHRISARDAFLSALTYYRTAIFAVRATDERYPGIAGKMQSCFRAAAKLFDPPIEPLAFPFQDKTLPGYFMPAAEDSKKRPTLIMVGGAETSSSELYFWSGGMAGRERGYNVLVVDMPGQGTLPLEGLYFRPDFEVPMKGVIDWLEKRKEVDPNRIAIYGISFGGYISIRIASAEKRIKACISSTPIGNLQTFLVDVLPEPIRKSPELLDMLIQKWDTNIVDHYLMAVGERMYYWSLGVKTLAESIKLYGNFKADVSQITCPVLCMVGDGESLAMIKEAKVVYDQLRSPKVYRPFTQEEGADAHCQTANLRLAHQVLFDWLDEVFKH